MTPDPDPLDHIMSFWEPEPEPPPEELPLDNDERAQIGLPPRESPIAPDYPPSEHDA